MKSYRIAVTADDEDLAVALLWEAGTTGIEVLAETTPGEDDRTVLLAYFDDDARPDGLEARLGDVTVEETPVPEVDWVARFRESFGPSRTGGFIIAPPWAIPPGSLEATTLVVDPGRAFGTGTHETTRLCLAALEERAARRPLGRVLDVGAGTGLLAVASLRLGAASATATDLDPEATAASQAHARLNGVRLHVVRADGVAAFRHGVFDLVVANLTAPLLQHLAADLGALPRPGGALVLSGLLEADGPAVQAAFAALGRPRVSHDGEWVALAYERTP
jgi:ribosomal protein L11 methyltransferase